MSNPIIIYTVGHSNHKIEKFIVLLKKNGVNAVVDVRSNPFSRYNPQFNKDTLSVELQNQGIAYFFLGKELGARPDDLSCYEDGKVKYARLANTSLFKAGIERVLNEAQKYRIALMCAEKEPLDCHRTLLVSRALEEKGVTIIHILADGNTENQKKTMLRLVKQEGFLQGELFRSEDKSYTDEQLVSRACEKRVEKIAYVEK